MVVQGTNVAHLLELQALAMSLSLPAYLVQDAGLTQVGPFLSNMVCTCLSEALVIIRKTLSNYWYYNLWLENVFFQF